MSETTTATTTNETHPLEGMLSVCCGQNHKHGELYNIGKREIIGYCSLCDEPVRFLTNAEWQHLDGGEGREDRYLDSSWEDRNEIGCW